MPELLKFCIADDHTLFRKAFIEIVLQRPGVKVVFDAENGIELLEKLQENEVDILLLDLVMPGIDGRKVISILKKNWPHIKIIIISSCVNLQVIDSVIELGAHAYLSKTADLDEFWDAIEHVKNNRLYENKLLKHALYWRAYQKLTQNDPYFEIKKNTTHQKLFELLWQEKSTQEIARELYMSISSIEKLKQLLKEKVGAKSTIGLIKYAINNNLILINPQEKV